MVVLAKRQKSSDFRREIYAKTPLQNKQTNKQTDIAKFVGMPRIGISSRRGA